MGPAREIFEEGFRIPPVYIVRRGQINRDVLAMILANCALPRNAKGISPRRSPPATPAKNASSK